MAVLDLQGSADSFASVKAIWRGIFGSTGALVMDICGKECSASQAAQNPLMVPLVHFFPAQHLVACAYRPPSEPLLSRAAPNIAEHWDYSIRVMWVNGEVGEMMNEESTSGGKRQLYQSLWPCFHLRLTSSSDDPIRSDQTRGITVYTWYGHIIWQMHRWWPLLIRFSQVDSLWFHDCLIRSACHSTTLSFNGWHAADYFSSLIIDMQNFGNTWYMYLLWLTLIR